MWRIPARGRSPEARPSPPAAGGWWDCHCHVLPALDDGPRDWDTALAMLRLAAASGTGTLIATPHAVDGLYPTTAPQVRQAVSLLAARGAAAGIGLRLLPGQEIALVPDLAQRIRAGQLLTLGDAGTAALVELPSLLLPAYWEEALFALRAAGLIPVIAHVERTSLWHQPALARRLVASGARFQLNASVFRAAGATRRQALHWVAQGWIGCLGSDGHNLTTRPPTLSRLSALASRLPALDALLRQPPALLVPHAAPEA